MGQTRFRLPVQSNLEKIVIQVISWAMSNMISIQHHQCSRMGNPFKLSKNDLAKTSLKEFIMLEMIVEA